MKSTKTKESESLERTTPKKTSPTTPDTKYIREGLTVVPGPPYTESNLRGLTVTPGLAALDEVTETFKPTLGLAGLGEVTETFKPTLGLAGLGEVTETFKPTLGLAGLGEVTEAFKPTLGLAAFGEVTEAFKPTPGLAAFGEVTEAFKPTPGLAAFGEVTEAFKPPTGLAAFGEVTEAFKPTPGLAAFGEVTEAFKPPTGLAGLGAVAEAFKPSSKLYDANRILELVNAPSLFPDAGSIQESLEISSELPSVATDHPSPIRITYLSDPNTIVRPAPEIRLQIILSPILEAAETSELDESFDPVHWQMFSEFEICLRRIVQQVLAEVVGPNWMRQRVPHDIREKWQNRQAEDRACGRAVSDAIQYADFMDLYSIITRGDNWREAFQATFLNREDISVSFRRLNPVRRALAHSRPLTPLDIVTLIGEVSRILGRLGVRALH